jgi:Na+/proline symporter/serine phosphatase RsbU (regulator of sigma subunit)/anti-sigma regulatory factor (Ser/Thr protein kinase)
MTDIPHGVGAIVAYVALLFLLALWAERSPRGSRMASGPVVYSLSLAVYCSTWTFYGSVGLAASRGLLFLAIYLGPTMVVLLWWQLLRKLVRIKAEHRVTSLADLISLRYGRSQAIAIIATGILVVGIVPYIALQLKTMIVTAALVAGRDVARSYPAIGGTVGPPIVLMMIVFTVAFGIRHRSPTERHPGMMAALSVECVVKLVAFVAAGAFVTWGLFDGFGDLFRRAAEASPPILPALLGAQGGVATWASYLILSASAVLLLPRQFHVAVVEISSERDLRTAMWLFPGFLLVINVFVLPLAVGGLLLGHSASLADTFVLSLPLAAGQRALSWLVFIGGFSAGTGMVMVETMTAATMISNHLLLPAADLWRPLERLRHHILPLRWCSAAAVIGVAFLYERAFGSRYALVSIGLVSFAAVLQLAPAFVGGLTWRGATAAGAAAAMIAGFATWSYTLALPLVVRAGWLPERILTDGPAGIALLRPEALLGTGGLDPLTHAVLWSLLFNAGAFVLGSLIFPSPAEEAERAARIVDALAPRELRGESASPEPIAEADEKRVGVIRILCEYYGDEEAEALAAACLAKVGAGEGTRLGPLQLGALVAEVETALASSIGAAAAHAAMKRSSLLTPGETRAVSRAYGEVLADLQVSPAELHRKIDYHREHQRLLEEEAAAQRFLAAVSARLAASLDFEATAHTVVHLPVPALVDSALLWLPGAGDHASTRVWFAHVNADVERQAAQPIEAAADELASIPCIVRALASGRPTVSACERPGAWPAALRAAAGFAQDVTIPLVARGRTLGTLSLIYSEANRARAQAQAPLAEELSHRAAIALENAALFRSAKQAEGEIRTLNSELERRVIARTAELQAANKLKDELLSREQAAAANLEEARKREIEIGFRIQRTLLLGQPPRDVRGLQVAALTIPSQWIDGDFYEFFRHENDCLDLIIGDVMGKGIPAALLGAAAKSHFLEAMNHLLGMTEKGTLPQPKDIVTLAHGDMVGHLIALESFVTLCYARLDMNRRSLDLVDCGHPPLIHLRARTGLCELRQGDNLPLGIREGERYGQISVPFETGDVFLFYSDGITEAPGPAGELFGMDRLTEAVRVNRELEPEPLVEAIRRAVFGFAGSDQLADDLTCVAIKVVEGQLPIARAELEIAGRLTELRRAREFVRAFCCGAPEPRLDPDGVAELVLTVNEAASNVMKHAYGGRGDQPIRLEAEAFPDHVSIVLRHLGDPFDPSLAPPPPLDGSRESGFGIYLITRSVDDVRTYRDERGRCCIALKKSRRS